MSGAVADAFGPIVVRVSDAVVSVSSLAIDGGAGRCDGSWEKMRMSFWDQRRRRLAGYLPEFKSSRLSYKGLAGLPEKTIRSCLPASGPPCDLQECDLHFLFHYDVFPPTILKFFGEWQLHDREMQAGDVIVQQARIPPGRAGLKFLFGVRVLSVYRSSREAGFSYGTLTGHPETGTNEFSFSVEAGSLFAAVRTVAAPGLLLSRLLAPVFTKPYVAFCNARALRRMTDNFLRRNPPAQAESQENVGGGGVNVSLRPEGEADGL